MLVATGGVLYALSWVSAEQLRTGNLDPNETPHEVAERGKALERAGAGLMIAGGVAIAVSIVWAVATPSGKTQVSIAPVPGGGVAVMAGTF